jgi:flagellar biosynthesis/type III secretory pathway chaperone
MQSLDGLLEAEREALLQGDLGRLKGLLPDKEALISALNAHSHTNLSTLEDLDAKARRNQVLLEGALDGIREVSTRMAALQKMRDGLATYGSDGLKHTIKVDTGHSVERRA